MDVEKDMIKAMHMIKAALCEPHNEVQQLNAPVFPVWGTESTSNTQEKYEKMTCKRWFYFQMSLHGYQTL